MRTKYIGLNLYSVNQGSMHHKILIPIFFTIFLILCILEILLGIWGLYNAEKFVFAMVWAVHSTEALENVDIDIVSIEFRWVICSLIFLFVGLIGSISCIGIFLKKAWARIAWITLIALLFVYGPVCYFSNLAIYRFEEYSLYDSIIYFTIFVLSVYLLRRPAWEKYTSSA